LIFSIPRFYTKSGTGSPSITSVTLDPKLTVDGFMADGILLCDETICSSLRGALPEAIKRLWIAAPLEAARDDEDDGSLRLVSEAPA